MLPYIAAKKYLRFQKKSKRYRRDIMSELVIEAGRTERQYWRDLWRYREFFSFLHGVICWSAISRRQWESAGL